MVIILLHDLTRRPHIKLHDLLIAHARNELIIIQRIIPHHMRRLPRRELGLALPRLRVPNLHVSIVARGEELAAGVVEGDVVAGARVACVGAQQLALVVGVEEFYFARGAGGEEEVS